MAAGGLAGALQHVPAPPRVRRQRVRQGMRTSCLKRQLELGQSCRPTNRPPHMSPNRLRPYVSSYQYIFALIVVYMWQGLVRGDGAASVGVARACKGVEVAGGGGVRPVAASPRGWPHAARLGTQGYKCSRRSHPRHSLPSARHESDEYKLQINASQPSVATLVRR